MRSADTRGSGPVPPARGHVPTSFARTSVRERSRIGTSAPADLDERLVWVRISAFGQDGPYSEAARARPARHRLRRPAPPDRRTGPPPVSPGVTVSDYLTGVFAAEAALAALYRRDARGTGKGAVIDASLYGSVLRILEWTIAAYDRLGTVREREGNELANSAPLGNYPTADGRFVCIVAGSDANFARLCKAMERPDVHDDPRFATLADRAAHGDAVNGIVRSWTIERTCLRDRECMRCQRRACCHCILGHARSRRTRTSPSVAT